MPTRRIFIRFLTGLALTGVVGSNTAYSSEPILKVQGLSSGQQTSIALDLSAMDKMPQTTFSTTTPWHSGVTEFSGVSLKDFLSSTQLSGKKLQIIALNDYEVQADISEMLEAGALLATRQNGAIMPVSDKGPVFLVFPFDSRPELQHQTYYSRAVWQIAEINVQ